MDKEEAIKEKFKIALTSTIKVISEIDEMNKVKINFNQKIYRNSDLLVEAEVLVISVNKLGKITKIPNEIYLHLVSLKN